MPFVAVRDIDVYYELQGTGPRLMLISGTGGDLRKKPSAFEMPVADSFELLAYDQRGLGQSSRPDIEYTMAHYADDAAGLLDALGWDSCHVMGISFGGMVAQEFAIRYPHRVECLALACTSSGGSGGASYPLHKFLGSSAKEYTESIIPLMDNRLDDAWQAAHPEDFAEMVEMALVTGRIGADEPNRAIGARRQIEARIYHDTFDRLPQITAPVFICGGHYDSVAPPDNQAAMTDQIPHARMELFEGGHRFLWEDPLAFQRIIAFLNG